MVILLATILIVTIFLLTRWFANTDPQSIRQVFKIAIVVIILTILIVLLLTGRLYVFIVGIIALAPLAPFIMRSFSKGAEAEMHTGPSRTYSTLMTRAEALHILNLTKDATPEEIKKAHKELTRRVHPDQGGSDYLMQKVNQARDVLLRK